MGGRENVDSSKSTCLTSSSQIPNIMTGLGDFTGKSTYM